MLENIFSLIYQAKGKFKENHYLQLIWGLNAIKLFVRSISSHEEDLLSMILHWEVAARKTVSEPELLELKKLCKDKTLFLKLGCCPLIDQENLINEWITHAKEDEVFRNAVQDIVKYFEGKKKLEAMFFLIQQNTCVAHTLNLKVIQLVDKISGNKEMLKKFQSGKFHEIDKKIESIFKKEPEVKKMFEKLKASKNLEAEITSLFLKTSDESPSEMFWDNSCAKCGYKLDPKIGMDKPGGKNSCNMSVCLSNIYLSENFPVFQTFF
jgi:hypothetical protein